VTGTSGEDVVWLPFAYRARMSFADHPRNDRALLRGRVPVALAAVTAEQAPVVAEAGGETYRWRDDAWLRPVRMPGGRHVGMADIRALGPRPTFAGWADYPLFGALLGLPDSPFAEGAMAEDALPDGAKIRSSERGAREGYARAAAADLIDVDGTLWRRCPEPHLRVGAERAALGGRLVVEVVVRPDPARDAAFFRLDELEAAMSHARALAVARNKLEPEPPAVAVPRPDVLSFSAERAMAARLAFELGDAARKVWFAPHRVAEDPEAAAIFRLVEAVDRHSARAEPFPVLAAAGAIVLAEGPCGRYGRFLREAAFPAMVPQLRRWAAERREAIATSQVEDDAIAGFAPG
jgi:hypothetical protein